MAETYPSTVTGTFTRARTRLIEAQFEGFGERFGFACAQELPGVIKDQLVEAMIVYARRKNGDVLASVRLSINWLAHGEFQEITEVSIDEGWNGDVSPHLSAYLENFEGFVTDENLQLDRRVELTLACLQDRARYDATLQRLSLTVVEPAEWGAVPIVASERLRGLAELSTELQYANDEGE